MLSITEYLGLEFPPIDENFLAKKRAEGMTDEVAEFYHRDEFDSMVMNFLNKSKVLKKHSVGHELSYYDFIDLVYAGAEEELLVVTANDTYTTMNADDLIDYMSARDDVYVSPCTFMHGCYRADTCKNVYALVIDVDNVKAEVIDNVLKNGNLGKNIPMPTVITNSGNGLHFYYVLKNRVPFYKKQRKQLNDMYRRLFGIVKSGIYAKADWHSMIQPFRLPGSLTKLGLVATAYQFNDKWDIKDLSKRLGYADFEWDLTERPVLSQQEYKEHLKKLKERGELPKKKPRKVNMNRREGLQGFYDYALQRTFKKTVQGNRYKSLVALTIIGYKARIPKEELEADFKELVRHFNTIGTVFREKEIKKALKAYNSKAERVRSDILEEYFGWEFERWREKAKANSKKPQRTQEEHLKRARALQAVDYPNGEWRNREGRPSKQQIVADWQREHPSGKKIDCERETGLSRHTVLKWWDKAEL